MKKLLFTASLLLLALGGNDSLLQANIPSLLPTARAAEQEESSLEKKADRQPLFIWKCKKEDQTVYLLGTIHVAKANFYPLPAEMENALNESRILFVEADVLQADPNKTMDIMKKRGICQPPATLTQSLSPETVEIFKQYLDWAGENLSAYQPYKPWVVSQLVANAALRKAGYKPELGIDRHLLNEAHAVGKKIIPLESIDMQLSLMDSFDASTQEKLLLGTLITNKDTRANLETLEKNWKEGKVDELTSDKDKTGSSEDLEKVRVAMLDKRNQTMVENILKNLPPKDSAMVAVGAAHLGGQGGLLAKLKEHGFEVEQITAALKKPTTAISFGGSALKRLYFSEGLFRIMLPGDPEVKYEDMNGIRMVDYGYNHFNGAMTVSYLIMPRAIPQIDKQKQFMQLIANAVTAKLKGTGGSLQPLSNAPVTMLYSCKLPGKDKLTGKEIYLREKMLLSGRRLYLVGGQGTTDFLTSKLYGQFEGSLEVIPEQGYATAASFGQPGSTGFGSSHTAANRSASSFNHADFDKTRKEMQQRSDEFRRKVQKDLEKSRADFQYGRNR